MTVCRLLNKHLKPETSKTAKPKRIIYIWNYLEWGGAQIYFLGIARRLKKKAEILFVFPRKTRQQLIDFCNSEGIRYEFLELNNDLQPAPTLRRKIARHLTKFHSEREILRFLRKFDLSESIVHIELSPWQSVFSLIRLALRTRVFITMHNRLPQVSRWRFYWWKLKFALISCFRNFYIFTSNQDTKESLKTFVSDKFLEKTAVTFTNVNPDEVEQALKAEINIQELKKKFGLPDDKFLVLCLGQFIDRKGRWVFLKAAKILREKSDKYVFVWISNSVLTDEEKQRIVSFEVGDSFFLLNSEVIGKEHVELMKFLRIADVFTIPSYVEGLPIALLEAMAMGIASISTNVNAIPEAIKHMETGILIEKGNSAELAGAIEKLKNDETLRKKLSRNGQKFVLENFNEKQVAEIVFENYRRAFDSKNK
jgi:glycosyltransferase involved in cell wall biosynthesis